MVVVVEVSSKPARVASRVSTTPTSINPVDLSAIARVFVWKRSCAAALQDSNARSLDKCVSMIQEMIAALRQAVRIVEGCAFGHRR